MGWLLCGDVVMGQMWLERASTAATENMVVKGGYWWCFVVVHEWARGGLSRL